MKTYKKYEKDSKVAVLISPGFGAGWSTWNNDYAEELCFDTDIVEAVLAEDYGKAESVASLKYEGIYTGGCKDLEVMWLEKGSQFEVEEYDGSESLHVLGHRTYFVA